MTPLDCLFECLKILKLCIPVSGSKAGIGLLWCHNGRDRVDGCGRGDFDSHPVSYNSQP